MFWTGIGSFGIVLVVILYSTAGNKTPSLLLFCIIVAFIFAGGSLLLEFHRKYKLSIALRTLLQNFIHNLDEFCATQLFISPDNDSMIAIDAKQKKIVIVFTKTQQQEAARIKWIRYEYDHKLFYAADLVDVTIVEDNRTMQKRWFEEHGSPQHVSPQRFLRRPARQQKIQSMALKMLVKDVVHAHYAVNFFPLHMSIRKDSKTYC